MKNTKIISQQIDDTKAMKMLAEAFEEVSVIRMQRVRGNVLLTRDYLDKLADVFVDVRSSYKKEIAVYMEKQKSFFKNKNRNALQFSTMAKNGKTVVVLLSANTKFYGNIIERVYDLFIDTIRDKDVDIVIVGRLGREMYESEPVKKTYTYFHIPDLNFSISDLEPIVNLILGYEHVQVFYGKFSNMATQVPTFSNVSGDNSLTNDTATTEKVQFHFEPGLENILKIFESQVFSSLFKQTVHEAELARLASRITAMEQALASIQIIENRLKSDMRRVKHSVQNSRQIEAFAGMSFWVRR